LIGKELSEMPKPIKENVIEEELIRRVKAAGGICEKVTVLSSRGFFDRLVVLPGRIVFVECKKPRGGRVSAHQMLKHDRYRRLGAAVVVVKTFADIDRLMAAG
jgi:hypothetical protein